MTIVISIVTDNLITLTVDSVETDQFPDGTEYKSPITKAWIVKGIGCVATWGSLAGNPGPFLYKNWQHEPPEGASIDDLAESLYGFLKDDVQPQKDTHSIIGYQVTGFDRQRKPKHYNVAWDIKRPGPESQPLAIQWSEQHLNGGPPRIVYNGRNDLAGPLVGMMFELIQEEDHKFDISKPFDMVRFGDFVARVISELTQQVGPKFVTYAVTPDNAIGRVENDSQCPITDDVVQELLTKLHTTQYPLA